MPALVVPNVLIGRAAAALTAAFFVMAADTGHEASAQGRLEAEYTASIAGIPIGRGNWIIEIFDDQYTAAGSGTTTGILRFFTGAAWSIR